MLPLDEQDREDVKTLADARVSSKHITNFLNERIGCKVTPQQTRNLIRNTMGNDSAEVRLKTMLHALRQVDDSDVLVLQDQLGLTTAIVMQTKVQKIMFDHWGETLAMDFTHGTNNLGYHLGSLVVTTATGRGFPVFDFVCLYEQALTVSTILNYFKEKNPGWRRIESVVIDKDYVEWNVLKELFPRAKILLCQFHAISYWKKVVRRPIFRLKVSQSHLVYGTTFTMMRCINTKRGETENDVDSDDESEEGDFSSLDPSDAMETVKLMDELENYVPALDGRTDDDNESESEENVPPTQISALQGDIRPSPPPPSNADLDKNGSDADANNN
ncbi:hypothetical protein PF005_g21954 [Phytophthora fragariae]|uniref:ZSWIM1/3 RNaseH-like domain-containing protein n=2 Tax=Phytophthora fragariae TaxID=53985 RepID=A0A6A3WEN5_9STRA|nr:hypothetical protein PF005_g21954 [Phytophthora fragariae]